ncbi:unnamed protein product [Laminaria digitata]
MIFAKHIVKLRTVPHQVLSRVIGFNRRHRRPHHPPLVRPRRFSRRCESVETVIRNRRLFLVGVVARPNEGRLPSRAMVATMKGGQTPRPGGQSTTWHTALQ